LKKMVFIVLWLTEDPEAYEGVTNADVEAGLSEEVEGLPYVERVEKVTVLDVELEEDNRLPAGTRA
jgi:hypothetical protein